jgi:serine/threonine-protein kinase
MTAIMRHSAARGTFLWCAPVALSWICAMALAPGTRLGPYQITAQIAAGGMGVVHLARDTRLDRDRGRRVDKRTDLWSFCVVLYEMLVGAGPFHGETASDSIGAVLHKDIDLSLLPAATPPMVRHVLARCLERNRETRYRDIGDVRIELEHARTDPRPDGEAGVRRLTVPGLMLALVLAVAAGALAWVLSRSPRPSRGRSSTPRSRCPRASG